MNYRSVLVLGMASPVDDLDERLRALEAIVDHAVPGRWREVRPPTGAELRETAVLRIVLAEASAKIRSGPPLDDAGDVARACWAGVLPLKVAALAPVAAPGLAAGTQAGLALTEYGREATTGAHLPDATSR